MKMNVLHWESFAGYVGRGGESMKAYIHRSYNLIYHPANHKTVQPMLMMHTSTRSATARTADAVPAYVHTIAKGLMLCLLICVAAGQGWGQTNPTAQTLPYSQNFSGFTGSTTTYPAGVQGWTISGSLSTSYPIAAPNGDQALAGGSNASTTAGVYDMNGKIGLVNTGSALRAIVLAINTTGLTDLSVSYVAATQRNENTRVNGLGLQYRIGTSGTFTDVAGSEYQNNLTPTQTTGTSPLNPQTISVTLPAACNNEAVVQLRWVIRDISGSGNRPSFSVDDISITGSSATPSIAISTPHPASTNISQGSTNNILASYQLDVTTATATLNSISVTTAGTYAAADIATNGFKFWINSANNLTGATQLGASQAAVGSGGTVAVTGLSQSVPIGTRYILVTADIASGATASNTISLASTAFSNIVFASGDKTGTDPAAASNAMTIIACTPTNVTALSLTPGNTQISVSWTNPSCLDEVMIVAKVSSSISASPSGDGSAYTANLAFGSSTGFDGGFVVYKGSTSPQTITGLTNGTTYFVKVFTRKGTDWTSGVESSATPNVNTYTWDNSHTRTAWARVENWTGGVPSTFPGADANTSSNSGNSSDICVIGSVGFSGSEMGLNFGASSNTGVGNNSGFNGSLSVGAIHFNGLSKAISLGKSDGSMLGSLLTLTGGTINSVPNTVIRQNSTFSATIAGLAGGSSENMTLALGNSTNNIISVDNSGNLIISCAINSASGPVTISGSGSGSVEFTGQNTYTQPTTVNGGTLRLNRTGGSTLPSGNDVVVNSGGTLRISTDQTLNNVTVNAGGTLTVDAGVTLTINGTYTVSSNTSGNAGTIVMGAGSVLQINQGGWPGNTGTFTYNATATLVFNNTTGSYGVNSSDTWWPSSSGPTNVTVQGAGGITMNVSRTVSGTFQTAAGVTNANNLTLNGTARINTGGFFTGGPRYGSASILVYNTGGTFGRGDEWSAIGVGTIGTTTGYPNDVQVSNNTTLNLPNGNNSNRACARDLTVDSGSALFADYSMGSVLLVVGRNFAMSGNVSLGSMSGGDLYVRGNFTRSAGTFNTNNRAVIFDASSGDQSITGATTFDFFIVNKSSGNVVLNNDITVNQTLTLTNGKIALGANNLTIGASGSISGANASKYIQTNGTGKLIRTVGTSAVSYPVGNSSYNPATLTRTTASNNFGVRVLDGVFANGLTGSSITANVVNRTWDVTLEGGSVGSLTIQVQWNGSEEGAGFNRSVSYLSHYTGGGWQQTTAAAASGSNPYTLSRSGITSLSPFASASSGALPISLTHFSGKPLGAGIRLDWGTASEQNNDYMAVERSAEGSRWEELGRVAGAGTTTLPQEYTYTDEKPLPGLNYYRLRQVDYDGAVEYHKTIAVDFKSASGELRLFPSPAKERLNIQLPSPAAQDSELWLLDAQGRILQRLIIPQGGTQGAFEVAALPAGVYFVRMAEGDARSFRFVR